MKSDIDFLAVNLIISLLFLLLDPKRMGVTNDLDRVWAFVVKFCPQRNENYQYVAFDAKTVRKRVQI